MSLGIESMDNCVNSMVNYLQKLCFEASYEQSARTSKHIYHFSGWRYRYGNQS